MLREENFEEPDVQIYGQILIQMSGICFTTLHNFRRILLRQLGKMDYDIDDVYVKIAPYISLKNIQFLYLLLVMRLRQKILTSVIAMSRRSSLKSSSGISLSCI